MSKSSLDYWREREQEANKNAIRDEAAYNKRIEEIYDYTERNIQRTINDFYARYASKNGITMNEARKRVREIDMRHYEQLARKYVREHDFSQQANEEMALYNLTMKVNRLELLKAEINLELLAGYDDIEHEMQKDLLEQAMKVNARYAGILGKSAIGNQKYAHQLVNASFRGATFSERLWGRNMPDLRAHLEVELRNGLIQGLHPRELAQRFRKHYGGSVKDTERLMVTEMRRLQTSVQKESFERNGYKDYQFISAGDERVCPECAKLHGQHFKVSEMRIGENAPPMHPSCHCSVAAWSDKEKYNRWIEALANGEDVRWDEFEADREETDDSSLSRESVSGKINLNSIVMSQQIKDAETHEALLKVLKSFGCSNVEGLDTMSLESARFFTAGFERAEQIFGHQVVSKVIVKKRMRIFGDYHTAPSTIELGRKKAEDPAEAFLTAIHERAHHYDHTHSSGVSGAAAFDYSTKIINQALKNIGLTMKGKDGQNLIYHIYYKWDKKDCSEVFARAVEFAEIGSNNKLVNEINRMLLTGELPK